MSDIFKVQTSPQFNWYNQWTHLDADGMPDKTLEQGLKPPKCIKVSFTVNRNDCTGLVVLDQACVFPEYFLVFTLPDFEPRILEIPEDKQNNNGMLFMRMEQCFQGAGLTSGPMLWQIATRKQATEQGITLLSVRRITARL